MRKLTAAEVTFEITIEADDTPLRGNVVASDDPEQDRSDEQDIIDRLNRGEVEAWCGVIVEASWESEDGTTYTGRDSIWGCSLDDSYTKEVVADEHGMREQALGDLNQRLACKLQSAERLARQLGGAL